MHTCQKKLKLSREAAMGTLTLELLSMKVSYCREPSSQHPATPQPGILVKAPLLSLDKCTEEQLLNKMQIAWITPQKYLGSDWSSTGAAGLKAKDHPSILPCVRSEVLALSLLLFVQGNYGFFFSSMYLSRLKHYSLFLYSIYRIS